MQHRKAIVVHTKMLGKASPSVCECVHCLSLIVCGKGVNVLAVLAWLCRMQFMMFDDGSWTLHGSFGKFYCNVSIIL